MAINHNKGVIGDEKAIEAATEVSLKSFAFIIGYVTSLNKDQTQFFADKLTKFTRETVDSIKNAPSSN